MTFKKRLLLGALLLWSLSSVGAETCPVPAGADPALARVPARERLAYLGEGLREARPKLRMWTHLWGLTWAAVTGVEVEIALTAQHKGIREDEWVQAFSTALGLVPTFIIPPRVSTDPPFEAKDDSCASVASAEHLMEEYVSDDRENTGAFAHAVNVGTNLAITVFLAVAYHHAEAAANSFAWGFPAGEVMILTYPKTVMHLSERYLRGEWGEAKQTQTSLLEWTRIAFEPLRGGGAALGLSLVY